MRKFLARLIAFIHFIESGLIAILLIAMIVLSVTDIIMRNLFDSGIIWIPSVVRILVLWSGLLGALYATRYNKHITVDVLARLLPDKLQKFTRSLTALFAAAVCALIAWHSYLFVIGTHRYGDTLFDDLPAWIFQAVIPVSFSLIGLRFLFHSANYLISSGQPLAAQYQGKK